MRNFSVCIKSGSAHPEASCVITPQKGGLEPMSQSILVTDAGGGQQVDR
jgi:hypothetical protein